MVTYPLDLPAQQFAEIKWNHESAVAFSRSPFSYVTQAQEHSGKAWSGTVSWPTLLRAEKAEVVTFMRKLHGSFGTFLMGVPGEETPRGSASTDPGTPVVDGAGQTGETLNIRGAPASVNGYLLEDDLIQLGTGANSRLYSVIADVNTDSIGDATISVWPDLRSSPVDGATVVVSNAKGAFRMVDNKTGFSLRDVRYRDLGFEFVEAL